MPKVAVILLISCAVQAAEAPKPIVLRAASMVDGKSAAVVSPGLVVVTDGKITGVGASAKIPADAIAIDLGDAIANGKVPGPRMQA